MTTSDPSTVLFSRGEQGCLRFRIPVLERSPTAILAFASHQTQAFADTFAGIWLRRSIDDGRTWSKPRPVVVGTNVTNQIPIYDPIRRCFWLAYAGEPDSNDSTSWITRSDNDGLTWSEPVDITSQVKATGIGKVILGPNRGICLPSGRLIVPRYHRTTTSDDAWLGVHYSDDGETWNVATVDVGVPANVGAIEPSIALLPDGRLLMDCRHRSAANSRRQSISEDDGETWSDPTTYSLPGGECQGSLVSAGEYLGLVCPGETDERKRLTLYMSRALPEPEFSARHRLTVYDGLSAYSSAVALDDGSLYVAYEAGEDHHAHASHDIRGVRIPRPWGRLENPNPSDGAPATRAGCRLYIPPCSDAAAFFADLQGSQPVEIRAGHAVHAVQDRSHGGMWISPYSDEAGILRIEHHDELGECLRVYRDGYYSGCLWIATERADWMHRTGRFSIAIDFVQAERHTGEWAALLDNTKNGTGDGAMLGMGDDGKLNIYVRANGATRLNYTFAPVLTVGKRYHALVSCDGAGEPVQLWLSADGVTTNYVGASMTGSDVTTDAWGGVVVGNLADGRHGPFDGWIVSVAVADRAWEQ